MTEINKTTTRRTRGTFFVLHHRRGRKIVVSLCAGDYLEFREAGRRGRWQLPIETAFRKAVHIKVEADRQARRGRRATR